MEKEIQILVRNHKVDMLERCHGAIVMLVSGLGWNAAQVKLRGH